MNERTYVLLGPPVPLARPRFSSHKIYDSQKQAKFGAGILIARQHNDSRIFTGPLLLVVEFHFGIPKSREKSATQLRGTPHFYKPDLSNLIKWAEDVANGIIYQDDCQISTIHADKVWCDLGEEKTIFTIRELNDKRID